MAVGKLGIKEYVVSFDLKTNSKSKDGVAIEKHKNYPSIKTIDGNISRFSFYGICASDIQKQVSNLDSRKAVTF